MITALGMSDLDDDLAPWRALHHRTPASKRCLPLQRQVLDRVRGVDPLAARGRGDVLVAGDWHGGASWATSVIRRAGAAGVPLVLQLGDFGFWHGDAGEGYLDLVELTCRQEGVTVAWLDGNHKDFTLLRRFPSDPLTGVRPVRPHVWHLPRGHRWEWSGRTWAALGGAVSVDRALRTPGVSWWPGETLTDAEAAGAAAGGPVDVLLCHDRPAMVALARGQAPGSWHRSAPPVWRRRDLDAADRHAALLQTVVDALRPSRLFHGHLHERYDLVVDPTPWAGTCHVTALADQTSGYDGNATLVRLDRPDQRTRQAHTGQDAEARPPASMPTRSPGPLTSGRRAQRSPRPKLRAL